MSCILIVSSGFGYTIEFISCIATIIALIFTLYLWLLDKIGDDRAEYLKVRRQFIADLNNGIIRLRNLNKTNTVPQRNNSHAYKQILSTIEDMNDELGKILSYRFWERNAQSDDYNKITDFHSGSRYLISTLKRYDNSLKNSGTSDTIVGIQPLSPQEIDDMISDYITGLEFILEFVDD